MTLSIAVVDAKTSAPVTTSGLTLAIYTLDATGAVSKVTQEANTSGGVFNFIPPTGAKFPVTYRVVAKATGYEMSTGFATINPADVKANGTGLVTYTTRLIQRLAPPSDIPVGTSVANIGDGFVASTPAVSGVKGGAVVTIPSGVTAVAADGTPLAGSATLTVLYNNNATQGSMTAFPGGFRTYEKLDGTLSATPLPLQSGGAISVKLVANGIEAKTFSSDVTIKVSIPEGTFNPTAVPARPVASGDVIPIWTYGDDGAMHFFKNGSVGALDTTAHAFPVTFTTNHFSFYNMAWIMPGTSTTTAPVIVKGAAGRSVYAIGLLDNGGWAYPFALTGSDADPFAFTIIGAPKGQPATFLAYVSGSLVGTVHVADLGAGVTLDLANAISGLSLSDLNVKVKGVCATGAAEEAISSASIFAFSSGSDFQVHQGMTNLNGEVVIKGLKVNESYTIVVLHGDLSPLSSTVTMGANGNTVTFNYTVNCHDTGLTGTGS